MTICIGLTEFYDKLEAHDWFYYYSDSSAVFSKGQRSESDISREAHQKGGPFLELYMRYKDHIHSKTQLPKPLRPGGPKLTVLNLGPF